MREFEFALILEGPLEDTARLLMNAGCDDATFSVTRGVKYGEFSREAPTLADAAFSAISEVRDADLEVIRVAA